jgi:hypothetical protein
MPAVPFLEQFQQERNAVLRLELREIKEIKCFRDPKESGSTL